MTTSDATSERERPWLDASLDVDARVQTVMGELSEGSAPPLRWRTGPR